MRIDDEGFIRCDCGTPIAKIEGDVLVVAARHHGWKHVDTILVDDLLRWRESRDRLKVSPST